MIGKKQNRNVSHPLLNRRIELNSRLTKVKHNVKCKKLSRIVAYAGMPCHSPWNPFEIKMIKSAVVPGGGGGPLLTKSFSCVGQAPSLPNDAVSNSAKFSSFPNVS